MNLRHPRHSSIFSKNSCNVAFVPRKILSNTYAATKVKNSKEILELEEKHGVVSPRELMPLFAFRHLRHKKSVQSALKANNIITPTPLQMFALPYVFSDQNMFIDAPPNSGASVLLSILLCNKLLTKGVKNRHLIIVKCTQDALKLKKTLRCFTPHLNMNVQIFEFPSVVPLYFKGGNEMTNIIIVDIHELYDSRRQFLRYLSLIDVFAFYNFDAYAHNKQFLSPFISQMEFDSQVLFFASDWDDYAQGTDIFLLNKIMNLKTIKMKEKAYHKRLEDKIVVFLYSNDILKDLTKVVLGKLKNHPKLSSFHFERVFVVYKSDEAKYDIVKHFCEKKINFTILLENQKESYYNFKQNCAKKMIFLVDSCALGKVEFIDDSAVYLFYNFPSSGKLLFKNIANSKVKTDKFLVLYSPDDMINKTVLKKMSEYTKLSIFTSLDEE